MADILLQLAQVVPQTEAEGPGRRFAIWFQGCPLRCPGCCNPEMLPFTGGTATPLTQLLKEIEAAQQSARESAKPIEGITLLGGEPFAHAEVAAELSARVQSRGLTVMIFSGYTLESLQASDDPHVARLLSHTDLLVDGPYLRDAPESERRWIGSANQRVHCLSDKYQADDPRWQAGNTLEIRWTGAELSVNGFPATSAVGMWKRPPQAKTSGR